MHQQCCLIAYGSPSSLMNSFIHNGEYVPCMQLRSSIMRVVNLFSLVFFKTVDVRGF
jgi:hypothetical protein